MITHQIFRDELAKSVTRSVGGGDDSEWRSRTVFEYDQSQASLRDELAKLGCPWEDRKKALAGAVVALTMLWKQEGPDGWVVQPVAHYPHDVAALVVTLDQMAGE
jgi:hypothetical protein